MKIHMQYGKVVKLCHMLSVDHIACGKFRRRKQMTLARRCPYVLVLQKQLFHGFPFNMLNLVDLYIRLPPIYPCLAYKIAELLWRLLHSAV